MSVCLYVYTASCLWVCTGGDGFVAAMAAGGVLSGAALPTEHAVILGAEGLLGQGLVALSTAEAALVPRAPLVAELLQDKYRGWIHLQRVHNNTNDDDNDDDVGWMVASRGSQGGDLHLHLHLADAFFQSDLQRVHLLKERQQYIVYKDKNRAGYKHS